MIEAIGGRKLVVGMVILAVAIAATWLKGDVPPGLVQILGIIFASFVVGNSVEHAAAAYTSGRADDPATPEDESITVQPPNGTLNSDPATNPVVTVTPTAAPPATDHYMDALQVLHDQNEAMGSAIANCQKGISAILSVATRT